MKTEKQIREAIANIEKDYAHVLTGSMATVTINAPRALMQMDAETRLTALKWVLGEKFTSKLKGTDR